MEELTTMLCWLALGLFIGNVWPFPGWTKN